jgi:hypothetical protein
MSEKPTTHAQTRAARRQAMVKDRRKNRMDRYHKNKREMLIIKSVSIALAVIILAGIGFAGVNYFRDRDLNREPEGVAVFTYAQGNHIEDDIDYSAQPDYKGEIPPAGGAHNNTPQQCDVYTLPIRQESAIHSLEHGAVWITYQPALPADQVEALKDLAEGDAYMLMSPYEGLPAPIVLTAWNHQLQMQTFDKDTVERFIRSYKNKRGVTPEFGGSCSGTDMTVAQ